LVRRLREFDRALPAVVYCASGYRSMIAASVLRSAGFGDVSDLLGGYTAWAAATVGASRSAAVPCPAPYPGAMMRSPVGIRSSDGCVRKLTVVGAKTPSDQPSGPSG
jgi:hypothetical protein